MNLDEIIEALSNYVGTLSHDEDGIVFSNRNTLSHMKNVPLDGAEETASKYELRKVDTKVRCFLKIEPSIYRKDWLRFDIEEDTLEIIGGQPEQLSLFEQEEIGGCGCFVGDMEEKEKK